MLHGDFHKVAKSLVFSCKLAAYFQNTFLQEHFQVTAVKPLKQPYLRKLIKKVSLSHSKLVRLVLSFRLSSVISEEYQIFSHTSRMKGFVEIVNDLKLLTTFLKAWS